MSDKAPTDLAALVENISRCWQGGFHAYMAGPCFETIERATAYRDELDREGVTWKSRRDY
jgi:hypothetical protein